MFKETKIAQGSKEVYDQREQQEEENFIQGEIP